jgi:hypothetical protein
MCQTYSLQSKKNHEQGLPQFFGREHIYNKLQSVFLYFDYMCLSKNLCSNPLLIILLFVMQKSKWLHLIYKNAVERWQKKNSFANFGLQGWLAAVCKLFCFVAGFPLSLPGGEKKQKHSPQTAPPYQRSTNPVIRFCNNFNFLLSYQCVELVLHTCLQRPRV